MGQRAKISTANVTVANECQAVWRREARQTDANMAAFNDTVPETLQNMRKENIIRFSNVQQKIA